MRCLTTSEVLDCRQIRNLQRRQRDINVIMTSFCERWFNISNQTSKQRRYNVRRFDLKLRHCFNVGLTLNYGEMRLKT